MQRKKSGAKALMSAPAGASKPAMKTRLKRQPARGKCVVCGDQAAQFSIEKLCWVCRRLKISAWKETEAQPQMQD